MLFLNERFFITIDSFFDIYIICRLLTMIISHQSSLIAESNIQSITKMTAQNDQSMNEIASGNGPITSGAEIENRSVNNEVASGNSPATNVILTSSGLGLLSLPTELRVQVFRDLLLEHRPLSTCWLGADYQPFPAILNTCTLIRREAFEVMYGENIFNIDFLHATDSILNNQEISDTIQNVQFEARLDEPPPHQSQWDFLKLIQVFGSPSILRGTLNIIFHVGAHHNGLFDWFEGLLPRLANFKTIRVEMVLGADSAQDHRAALLAATLLNMLEVNFTPLFGPAVFFRANGVGLDFHPQDFLNSQDLTDADDSEASSTQNSDSDESETSTQNSDSDESEASSAQNLDSDN